MGGVRTLAAYSDSELAEWVPRVRKIEKSTEEIYFVFNNHFAGKAVCNALQVKAGLTGEIFELPPGLIQAYPALAAIAKPIPPQPLQKDLFP